MTARRPATRFAFIFSAAFVLLALASPAFADETDTPRKADATSYDFDDDLVQGDTVQPDVEVLHARRRGERQSLIRVRTHFIPELYKTAQDL